MRQHYYLLGFIHNRTDLPCEAPLWTRVTKVGEHGVIWCNSPKEMFESKQDFLGAMLQWFEQIREQELTLLPIQSGVSTFNESDLIDILNTYKNELKLCFSKIDKCSEYCLTIAHKTEEGKQLFYPPLQEKVQSGREYLERLRARQDFSKREQLKAQKLAEEFCTYFTPWIKDSRLEISGAKINANLLVPNIYRKEYADTLQSLSDNRNWTITSTGPWPPFDFSSFSLKPERFLRRELMQW
jgi:hypothetical protein